MSYKIHDDDWVHVDDVHKEIESLEIRLAEATVNWDQVKEDEAFILSKVMDAMEYARKNGEFGTYGKLEQIVNLHSPEIRAMAGAMLAEVKTA